MNVLVPDRAIQHLRSKILGKKIFLKSDSKIVFLCGAKIENNPLSARRKILDYSKKYYRGFQFLLAEDFFDAYINVDDKDLLSIEDELSKYSDCIIVIAESVSAFAIKDSLSEIMIVINDDKFKSEHSFINLGPIKKVDKKSKFKPTIHCNLENILRIEEEISKRLQRITKSNNTGYEIQDIANYTALSPKIRLFLLCDLITLLEPISKKELIYVLSMLFEKEHRYKIDNDLSLLTALQFIFIDSDYYLRNRAHRETFFMIKEGDIVKLKSIMLAYHFHTNRFKIKSLQRVNKWD